MNQTEIERLAAAVAQLRPDWPAASLRTFIARDLPHRAYRDAAVALVWVAVDPDSQTPRRVLEPGPWWAATLPSAGDRHPSSTPYSDGCITCGLDERACREARRDDDPHEFLSRRQVAIERARRYRYDRDRPPRPEYDPATGSYLPEHYRQQALDGISAGRLKLAERESAIGGGASDETTTPLAQSQGASEPGGPSVPPHSPASDPTPYEGSQPLDHDPGSENEHA